MNWFTFVVYCLLSFFLIILNNLIGNKSISYGYQTTVNYTNEWTSNGFNLIYRILVPIVFLLLVSIPFKLINQNIIIEHIYYVIIFYYIERFLIILFLGRYKLVQWPYELLIAIVTIFLGKTLASNFINSMSFLPSAQGMADQIWFLVILFIYKLFNDIIIQNNKAEKYHSKKLSQFIDKFSSIINKKTNSNLYKSVIYAIMINEDFNRPYFIRHIFERIGFIFNKVRTTGIMQVKNDKYLSDFESVEIGSVLIIDKLSEEISTSITRKKLEFSRNRKNKRIKKKYHNYETEPEKYSTEIFNTLQFYNKTQSVYELYQLVIEVYKKISLTTAST